MQWFAYCEVVAGRRFLFARAMRLMSPAGVADWKTGQYLRFRSIPVRNRFPFAPQCAGVTGRVLS
jgi:hypothetical protein